MINLLPPQYKEELAREEQWKIVLLLGVVIFFSFLCLGLILFSIEIYVFSQAEAQRIIFSEEQKRVETQEIKELQERISLANLTFTNLNSFYQNQAHLTGILERISKTIPPGIYLDNFYLDFVGEECNCTLSGFAPSSDILIEFKKNLEKETTFKNVSFPTSTWLSQTNINFNVSFKITK